MACSILVGCYDAYDRFSIVHKRGGQRKRPNGESAGGRNKKPKYIKKYTPGDPAADPERFRKRLAYNANIGYEK
jgi:hypothetical protein